MTNISTMAIAEEIARVLKKLEPRAKVYLERIETLTKPCFSIEVVSDNSTVINAQCEERRLLLDIIYYPKSNVMQEAIEMNGKLMSIFLPTFRLNDNKTFTFHQGVEAKFIDQDLHFLIPFEWRQSILKSFVDADNKLVTYNTTDETKTVLANRLHDLETMETITTTIERG